jgi:Ca-activated chloride channel family protein
MIEWASPWALVLLLPVLALPWQPRVTGVRRLVVPGPDVVVDRWTARRLAAPLPRALLMLGLTLAVLAMARPRVSERSLHVESEGLDILLAVDTSGSMRAQDFSSGGRAVDRLSVAKGVLAEFIEGRPYDRIGVVVFGEEAFTHVPLTLDHQTLLDVLESVQIGIAGENRTAIGQAIAVGAKRLKDLEAPDRVLILLTDGQNNAGRFSPIEAARLAAALDITIYTVGIGADGGRGMRLLAGGSDGIDEATLTQVAELAGGRYFRARDTATLQSIYDTIDELEPSPAEVEEIVQHQELFAWLLGPALAALAAGQLLGATWLRRFP